MKGKISIKDEVRKVGLELGIPEYLVYRQPFPGPGLGIRIIGEVTEEKIKIVQDADYIFREEIAKAGLDKKLGQYFAALTNMQSVGVMGDERTYDYAIALRAVITSDFMTADWARIPYEVLDIVSISPSALMFAIAASTSKPVFSLSICLLATSLRGKDVLKSLIISITPCGA